MLGLDHQNAGSGRMSLEQIQAFLEASNEVEFKAGNKEDLYDWAAAKEKSNSISELHILNVSRHGEDRHF